MEIPDSQADEIVALLRELVALQRARRKPRKRTAIERNRAEFVASITEHDRAIVDRAERALARSRAAR